MAIFGGGCLIGELKKWLGRNCTNTGTEQDKSRIKSIKKCWRPIWGLRYLNKMPKLPLKLIFLLNAYPDGLTYSEISQKTRYHKHTISKQISYLDAKGLINIEQKRSKNNKGRRWINFIKLKKELVDDNVTKFLSRISKQLNCSLNDFFIS